MSSVQVRAALALCAAAFLWVPVRAQTGAFVAPEPEPVSLTLEIDGKQMVLKVEGTDVVATEAGEPLPPDRMEKSNGRVTIKDAEGNPVAQVQSAGNWLQLTRIPRSNRAAIGVETGVLPQGLADHLGLDPNEVIYVHRVIEGRAAHEAGVQDHDVFLEIDGQKPVSESGLRRMLRKKKPGDEIAVRILRRGKEHEIKFRCERARSGFPGLEGSLYTPLAIGTWSFQCPEDLEMDAARKALERVQQQIVERGWGEEAAKVVEKELQKALGALRKVDRGPPTTGLAETLRGGLYVGGKTPAPIVRFGTGDRELVLIDPMTGRATPRPTGTKDQDQNKDLVDRLSRIERRFDEIEKMLEKLTLRSDPETRDAKIR